MEDITPPTQPSGALVPPPKGPGTAIATATPEPPKPPLRRTYALESNALLRFIQRTLDVVDGMADAVAGGLGLRHP